jgi:hypothetical protein
MQILDDDLSFVKYLLVKPTSNAKMLVTPMMDAVSSEESLEQTVPQRKKRSDTDVLHLANHVHFWKQGGGIYIPYVPPF